MAAQTGTPEGLEYMLSCCTPGGQGRYHFGEMGYENLASLLGLSRWRAFVAHLPPDEAEHYRKEPAQQEYLRRRTGDGTASRPSL